MGNTANASLSAVKTKNALSKDNVNCLELEEAREFFRKQQTRTSYGTMFGELERKEPEYNLLKRKPYSSLEISKFVQPTTARYIEKWINLNKGTDAGDRKVYHARY